MKKTILAGLILLCSTSSYALDLQDVSRESLLSSERLHQVSSADVATQSAEQVQALKKQLEEAKSGDVVTIAAGKYPDLGIIHVKADKVQIKAQEAGKAWLTGSVQINLDGDDSQIDGLVFAEGGPAEKFGGVVFNGDRNQLTDSTFYYFNDGYEYKPDSERQEYPRRMWVTVFGEEAKITNNRFEGKEKRGALIELNKNETTDKHIVENNIFLDMQKNKNNELADKEAARYNSNSWEAIQIGYSTMSQFPSETKFSNNLMINMNGEQELIAVKSCDNIISNNTIYESQGLISLRHGKGNHIENNIILGGNKDLTGGIRIYDEDHVIKNNYINQTVGGDEGIEGNADVRAAIVINTGITDPSKDETLAADKKGKELNKQWTPKNITIENNSIIDNKWGIIYGDQIHRVSMYDDKVAGNSFGADEVTFMNNLIYSADKNNVAVKATDITPITNATYKNEIYLGKVVDPAHVGDYSTQLPEMETIHGFQSAKNVGADVSKLKIITTDTAGPDYFIAK